MAPSKFYLLRYGKLKFHRMLLFLELEKKEYKKNRILKKQFLKSEF